jgi:hypothetical protein
MKTLTALLVFSALTVAPALAQTPAPSRTDGRWTPYLGCWRLLAENVRNQGIEELIQSAAQRATTPAMTVCVQPAGASTGVTMTTFADGKKVLEQNVVADAAGHPVADSGCNGTQTSDWSRDGLRLFTRVEMACNNRPKQTISGLTLFAKGPAWVDIQAMQTDGDQQVRIRRYMRTSEQPEGISALPAELAGRASIDAQNSAIRTLSQEDVTEASAKVASQAVEAAIVESESRFNLNSRALLQLADSGVSPNVIDLMVAQSFPSHFRVERPISAPMPVVAAYPPSIGMPGMPGILGGGYGYPLGGFDAWDYYGYYYSPFAYPFYWGNGYYNSNRYYITNGSNTVFVNGGNNFGGGTAATINTSRGQVVNGQGYTRVHTSAEAEAAAASQPTSRTTSTRTVRSITDGSASSSTPSTSTPSTSSSSSSSSGDSGGGVSTQGYSNGGGDSGGRTAQPR